MNLVPLITRGVSQTYVRKWAANALTNIAPVPAVVPQPIPSPATPPPAPYAAPAGVTLPKTGPLAAPLPAGHTFEQPMAPDMVPDPINQFGEAARTFRGKSGFDPANILKTPAYQNRYNAYKTSLPAGQTAEAPEAYLPKAMAEAGGAYQKSAPGEYLGWRARQAEAGTLPQDEYQQELQDAMGAAPDEAARTSLYDQMAQGYTDKDFVADYNAHLQAGVPYGVTDLPRLSHLAANDGPEMSVTQQLAAAARHPLDAAAQAKATYDAGMAKVKELNEAIAAKKPVGALVQDQVASKVVDRLGTSIDNLNTLDKQPDTGYLSKASDIFSDWRNWVAPVGALLTLFGGSTAKVLGGLMLAGGGVDLYNRYKGIEGLGQTPQGQKLMESTMTFKDAEGNPKPFGNLEQIMAADPQNAQAWKDLGLVAKLGGKNKIVEHVAQAGIDQAEKLGIPPATTIERLVNTGRLTAEQGKEMAAGVQAAQQRLAAQTAPAAANG